MTIGYNQTCDKPAPVMDINHGAPVADFRLPVRSLEETALKMNLTVEQVRQIEQRAMRKLRRNPRLIELRRLVV